MSKSTIEALVQEFVAKLEAAIRTQALAAAQAALGGGPVAAGRASAKAAGASRSAKAEPPKAKPAKAARATPKPKSAKRNRRSLADIDRDVERLVAFVRTNPKVTSEKARAALKLEKTTWTSTLKRALDVKKLKTLGEKRNTTLHLP